MKNCLPYLLLKYILPHSEVCDSLEQRVHYHILQVWGFIFDPALGWLQAKEVFTSVMKMSTNMTIKNKKWTFINHSFWSRFLFLWSMCQLKRKPPTAVHLSGFTKHISYCFETKTRGTWYALYKTFLRVRYILKR